MTRYEKIAQRVYEKAEECYKGSEINADTLNGILKLYFNYSDKTNKIVYNIFIQWERDNYNNECIEDEDGRVFEIEDTNGNTLMAFVIDKSGNVTLCNNCSVADEDFDYIFGTNKTLVRIQADEN